MLKLLVTDLDGTLLKIETSCPPGLAMKTAKR